MNRRRFLQRAGLAGVWTFLQACGFGNLLQREEPPTPVARLSTSTSSGIPTRIPTDTLAETLPPTSTATFSPLTSSPTVSATATSTATPMPEFIGPGSPLPSPTWTPVPPPTPYPPGPPSKLGLFVTQFEPDVLEITDIGKPALIKTLEVDANFAKGLKESSPSTLLVGRVVLDQINLDIDPQGQIQTYMDKILPIASDPVRLAAFDAWEAHNEPVVDTPDKMKRLADFEAERTRQLGEQGIRSVVGNFAAGNPALELWPFFEPALAAIRQYNGYLGLHEYSAPVMQFRSGGLQFEGEPDQGDEGWLTLRYRKVYRQYLIPMGYGDIPTLITECGVDGLVRPRPGPEEAEGWLDFVPMWEENGLRQDPPGVYMDQLIWYDENLQQDDYIKGAAIFLAGTNDPRWQSYNILGPHAGRLPDLLNQYLVVHPPDGVSR